MNSVRILASLCLSAITFSAFSQQPSVTTSTATMPSNSAQRIQKFAETRLTFLDNLKNCTPISLDMTDIPIPGSQLTLKITGFANGNCQTQSVLTVSSSNTTIISNCSYTPTQITTLTAPEVYTSLQNMEQGKMETETNAPWQQQIMKIDGASCQIQNLSPNKDAMTKPN